MTLTVATWNANSIRARLDQVTECSLRRSLLSSRPMMPPMPERYLSRSHKPMRARVRSPKYDVQPSDTHRSPV